MQDAVIGYLAEITVRKPVRRSSRPARTSSFETSPEKGGIAPGDQKQGLLVAGDESIVLLWKSTIEVWGTMCDDCVGVGPTITRRQVLWAPPAALGAALLADAPAYGATRTSAKICRSSWGGKPATGPYVPHEISQITLHHSAVVLRDNRKAPAQLRSFQADHQARGWPDIAYHLLIDRRGNLYQGRPAWAVGDTNTSYDPSGHLLVLALGNFQVQEISAAQLNMTVNVLAWACTRYGIEPARHPRAPLLREHAVPGRPVPALHHRRDRAAARGRAAGHGHHEEPCAGTPAGDGSARS